MKRAGDTNKNGQQLLRLTEERGTDHNSRIWILKCLSCLKVYGSNSTDAWERKCPKCQSGAEGLSIPTEQHDVNWTNDEHILAFRLYNEIPFGSIHSRNPRIQELSAILGRHVNSVSLKLANIARLDPVHQARGIMGMRNGAKGEKAVWDEYAKDPEALALKSEDLLATRIGRSLEEMAEIETNDLPKEGIERDAVIKIRVNQSFFRRRILSAYDFRCCVTGLTSRPLLTASHILSWAENKEHRLNPKNGLCLNALHDRAFDRYMMWIENGFVIRFSPLIQKEVRNVQESEDTIEWLTRFEGRRLILPKKFSPSVEFLEVHAAKCKSRARCA
jgi:putative restriction endonuclease